ncbi:MAG: RNA methyltransferase [Acidimicrobiia bacterium]|nr:RNA methyltransferase [Acidimicrobiia bacterium]
MATMIEIHDPADPRVADYVRLTDAELRRDGGYFIAESLEVVRRLLTGSHPVRSVLITPARYPHLADDLAPLDVPVFMAGPEVQNEVAGFRLHRGVVAAADRLPEPPLEEVLKMAGTLVVLEGLNDAENLGAIFRSARALGIDAVLLDPTCADPYYRRTVRVSMGAVFQLPFLRLAAWPDDLEVVRRAGFELVALTPDRKAMSIADLPVGRGSRRAVLLGAEGSGLALATLARADRLVRIPMSAGFDSLNVGHAAAIAFHRVAAGRAARELR